MKNLSFLFLLISLFVLSSCGLNISVGNDVKMSMKTIDGIQYAFTNQSKAKNVRIFLYRNKTFTNRISFSGLDKRIEKTLSLADFEKKLSKNHPNIIRIDSVSFTLNKQHDEIDFVYYLNFGNQHQKIVFDLDLEKNDWKFNL